MLLVSSAFYLSVVTLFCQTVLSIFYYCKAKTDYK